MIEMFLTKLAKDDRTGLPLVVLSDRNHIRDLPILLQPEEDKAIRAVLDKTHPGQDTIGNLLQDALTQFGYKVGSIIISKRASFSYEASIRFVALDPQKRRVPARIVQCKVFEAVALSVRLRMSILVAEEVVAEAGIPVDTKREFEESEKFKEFVANLKASDFRGDGVKG